MGWDACTLEPNAWLRWMECHPGVGSFIQAIGTIAAVGVALWFPFLSSLARWRVERSRRQRKIELRVQAIGTEAHEVFCRATEFREALEKFEPVPDGRSWRHVLEGLPYFSLPAALEFAALQTDSPPHIRRQVIAVRVAFRGFPKQFDRTSHPAFSDDGGVKAAQELQTQADSICDAAAKLWDACGRPLGFAVSKMSHDEQ